MWDKGVLSTREMIDRELDVLPEPLQKEVYDFVLFLKLKSDEDTFKGLALSQSVLSRDWDTPQEDAAWAEM